MDTYRLGVPFAVSPHLRVHQSACFAGWPAPFFAAGPWIDWVNSWSMLLWGGECWMRHRISKTTRALTGTSGHLGLSPSLFWRFPWPDQGKIVQHVMQANIPKWILLDHIESTLD